MILRAYIQAETQNFAGAQEMVGVAGQSAAGAAICRQSLRFSSGECT